MTLEIRVQRARCIASKSCIHTAPGVFALDDERIAVVVDPGAASEDLVLLAAESCPTGAISVVGETGAGDAG